MRRLVITLFLLGFFPTITYAQEDIRPAAELRIEEYLKEGAIDKLADYGLTLIAFIRLQDIAIEEMQAFIKKLEEDSGQYRQDNEELRNYIYAQQTFLKDISVKFEHLGASIAEERRLREDLRDNLAGLNRGFSAKDQLLAVTDGLVVGAAIGRSAWSSLAAGGINWGLHYLIRK